ncbi:hypothetical protein Godav_021181 [Gossypium davidsonii]|uniref:Uncharacterized protein n=1 Tax=Gossypium davidsonii TaxID=34287 RepID=A0A7J8R669_GOSDV|nr:hypothetical protein [Gossypium davidsonii]
MLLVDVLQNGLATISNQLVKMDEDIINCLVTLEDPPLFVRDLLEEDVYNSSIDRS